jgi:hypothetical protein
MDLRFGTWNVRSLYWSGSLKTVRREALVELTLERRDLGIWVFIAEITDEFILGMDVLWAYNASVDLGHHLLCLGQEEHRGTTNIITAFSGQRRGDPGSM